MVQENQLSDQEYNEVSELEKEIFNEIKLIFTKDSKANEVTKIYCIGRALARIQKDNIDLVGCLRMLIDSFVDEVIFTQEILDYEKKSLNNAVNRFLNSLDTKTTYKIN